VAKDCRVNLSNTPSQRLDNNNVKCYECGEHDHIKKDSPQLNGNNDNGNGGNNGRNGNENGGNRNNGGNGARERAFVINLGESRNDGNVLAGKFSIND
jgi:hypothetical protein